MSDITKILVNIQSKLKAPKGQKNNFGKYKYRSCEDIVEAVKPLLAKEGAALIMSDELVLIGERYYIKATVTISCEKESVSSTAYARETQDRRGMDQSQITGTASSYARKYALNGLLAIDDTKDADHESVSKDKVESVVIGEIDGQPVDMAKVERAASWVKKVIEKDDLEQGAPLIQEKYKLLTNDEKIKIGELLKDKAPGTNKMYSSILTEYLKYVPSEGVAT